MYNLFPKSSAIFPKCSSRLCFVVWLLLAAWQLPISSPIEEVHFETSLFPVKHINGRAHRSASVPFKTFYPSSNRLPSSPSLPHPLGGLSFTCQVEFFQLISFIFRHYLEKVRPNNAFFISKLMCCFCHANHIVFILQKWPFNKAVHSKNASLV